MLAEYNKLSMNSFGIWIRHHQKTQDHFLYSDGTDAEKYIREVMLHCQDLSSDSLELERWAIDWASEYHLSRKRANLIRPLNLHGIKDVLEIGSGCGALTRYVGELGCRVDAVEGSHIRAELTRLRCRELDNVHVIAENFNSLDLPSDSYDAVLFVGVLEYAQKFFGSNASPKHAILGMLNKAKRSLRAGGIILIAIENRTGFKYLFGASEDHYGIPYVGIHDYPRYMDLSAPSKAGIRTYSKSEWIEILNELGDSFYEFFYPFPDYKLPQVLLSESYAANDRYASINLSRTHSRDYRRQWSPSLEEYLFWSVASDAGYLDRSANSFAIVISDRADRNAELVPFDFIHFHNNKRKPEYRVFTRKRRKEDIVEKVKINDVLPVIDTTATTIHLDGTEPYHRGKLLSDEWVNALRAFDGGFAFKRIVIDYYKFLNQSFSLSRDVSSLIDLTPFNILMSEDGTCHYFDIEWQLIEPICADFVFFRSLTYFALIHKEALKSLCNENKLSNIKEFVTYFFSTVSNSFTESLEEYIALENRFQRAALLPAAYIPMEDRLAESMIPGSEQHRHQFFPKIYWALRRNRFSEKQALEKIAPIGIGRQVLVFDLPTEARKAQQMRFDPCDHRNDAASLLFQIYSLSIRWKSTGQPIDTLARWQGRQEVARHAHLIDITCPAGLPGEAMRVESSDPQMIIEVPAEWNRPDAGHFCLEIELNWPGRPPLF